MKKIVIATKNQGKVKEMIRAFRGMDVELVSLAQFAQVPEAVEDGSTFSENALIKARFYAKETGLACLADDSGLEVDALGGAPGVYSARFAGETADDGANNEKLVKELVGINRSDSPASYRCVLAFVDGAGTEVLTEGICSGIIRIIPAGDQGFGYDPYFYLPKQQKTMAELSLEEKNAISHRGMAIKEMEVKLAGYLR
jgi:non-canonical purine NTP pyrophosphatase, rdgB/HAM1 family